MKRPLKAGDIVRIAAPGISQIVRVEEVSTATKIGWRKAGEREFIAEEIRINEDTGQTWTVRSKKFKSRAPAERTMHLWQDEYQNPPTAQPLPPMPGIGALAPGCEPLTSADLEDTAKAQTAVLKAEYPDCFQLFAAITADPGNETLREKLKLAYVRDIARKTGCIPRGGVDGGSEHVEALVKAARSYKRRGRKAQIDSAVEYEIAFGWLHKGYCFLGDKELSARINAIFRTTYTAKDIHNRRSAKLGLVQKKRPGPRARSA